jgi:hypothetical protein
MSTTTETLTAAAEGSGRKQTIGASAHRAPSESVLNTVAYVLRTLAGAVIAIAVVWMLIIFYKHVETIAVVLGGALVAAGAVELFRRNRSLS